jgi:hypothetical protein
MAGGGGRQRPVRRGGVPDSGGGTFLGTPGGTQYTDETGTAAERTAHTITTFDRHGNSGAGTTLTAPAVRADARRAGVRRAGAYWGAAGEQIDLLSGNLSLALPLIKTQSRGGWSATFVLSYNSQIWRQDSGGTWKLGKDVGCCTVRSDLNHEMAALNHNLAGNSAAATKR